MVKKENARLDQLDKVRGKSETDGWRNGDLIRKGKIYLPYRYRATLLTRYCVALPGVGLNVVAKLQ